MSAETNAKSGLDAADLVIPIYNDLLELGAYLAATQAISLPSQITKDPKYQQIIDEFTVWQTDVWNEYYGALLNAQIVAQAQQISGIYIAYDTAPVPDNILQQECQQVFFAEGNPISTVQISCVQFANLIGEGTTYVKALTELAEAYTAVDAGKVKAAMDQVNTLNQQFADDEEQLNKSMLNVSTTIVTSIVKVEVDLGLMAVGDEAADPLKPLKEGVVQIGKDVGTAIKVDIDASNTLTALEDAIRELNEDEYQLVEVLIARNQLAATTTQTEPALKALSRLEIEWGHLVDLTSEPVPQWSHSGKDQLNQWASMMGLLVFGAGTTQTISYQDNTWSAN